MSYEDFEPERIKHLEMLQAVIARLGTDSFLIKGWAVTLTVALSGFAINGDEWRLALVAAVAAVALWSLDAYFLRAERLFRHLFDAVRNRSADVKPFFMAATSPSYIAGLERQPSSPATSVWRVAWSATLCWFYGSLGTLAIALAIILHCR